MRQKICEMVSVMRRAATVDDESADQEQEKVTQLLTENQGLKEMLKIHKRIGGNFNDDSPAQAAVHAKVSDTDTSVPAPDDDDADTTHGDSDTDESDPECTVLEALPADTALGDSWITTTGY